MRATKRDVDAWRVTLSNWGRWGPHDTAGTLNLITDDLRRDATQLVKSGHSVSCARPIDTGPESDDPIPAVHLMVQTLGPDARSDYLALAPHGFNVTHIDALGHFVHRAQGYNGIGSRNGAITPTTRLGIDVLKHGLVGRGVLLDIPRLRGVPFLEPGESILAEELEFAADHFEVTVGVGDTLLVRTGRWAKRAETGRWDVTERLAGLDPRSLSWLRSREIAVLGSDGVNDVLPSRIVGIRFPIHEVGLVTIGLHLLDNLDLEGLAAACEQHRRWEFLMVVAPLVVPHGTASPVNPIAVF